MTTQPLHPEAAITAVGRFAPYKGIDQLCSAAASSGAEVANGRSSSSARARFPLRFTPQRAWPSLVTVRNEYVSGAELHEVLHRPPCV